jgi:hypothetical protein
MELFAFGHSIQEGAKLELKVSEANERASKNELARIELDRILLPISFTNPALSSFKLSAFSGTEAEVQFLVGDSCSPESAMVLLSVLNDAKWKTHESLGTNANGPIGMFNSWVQISINVPHTNADRVILSNKCEAAKMLQIELINSGNLAAFQPAYNFMPSEPPYEIFVLAPVKFGAGADREKRSIFFSQFISNKSEWYWPPGFEQSSPNRWPTEWFKSSH